MSALLEKKYCNEQIKITSVNKPCNDGESNDGSSSDASSTSERNVVDDDTAAPLTVSPASIAVSIDDDSSQEDVNHSSPPTTPFVSKDGLVEGNSKKNVRFDVVDKVFIANDNTETINKHHGNNLWYTRAEYRAFWSDRMQSVRIWKCLHNDHDTMRSKEAFGNYKSEFDWKGESYSVRGLENYIFSSSEVLNRQRDFYTVAVLQDPYNPDGTLAQVSNMSIVALQRAQLYALHDAAGANDDTTKEVSFHRSTDDPRKLQLLSTAPMSPASVIPSDIFLRNNVKPTNTPPGASSIQDMNKRLIEEVLNDNASQDHLPASKKQKRQSSSTGSNRIVSKQQKNVISTQRRRSPSFTMSNQLQPKQPQLQHPSFSDPFYQQTQFYNQILNDSYSLDLLSMADILNTGNHHQWGMLEECMLLQQQCLHDFTYELHHQPTYSPSELLASTLASPHTSDGILNAIYQQIFLAQQQQQQNSLNVLTFNDD